MHIELASVIVVGILTIVIIVAPIYLGLYFSKKSAQKRREQEKK
jgi:uncharacterized protein YneF (UPF0154 family)